MEKNKMGMNKIITNRNTTRKYFVPDYSIPNKLIIYTVIIIQLHLEVCIHCYMKKLLHLLTLFVINLEINILYLMT